MIARSENYARSSKKKSREFRLLNCSGRVSGPPRPISSPPASSRCSSGKVPEGGRGRFRPTVPASFRPTVPTNGPDQRPRPTAPMLFRGALSGRNVPAIGPDALSGCPFVREGSHLFRAIYSKRHLNSANSSRRFTPSVSFHRVNHPISWVGRVLVPTRFDHSIASPPNGCRVVCRRLSQRRSGKAGVRQLFLQVKRLRYLCLVTLPPPAKNRYAINLSPP